MLFYSCLFIDLFCGGPDMRFLLFFSLMVMLSSAISCDNSSSGNSAASSEADPGSGDESGKNTDPGITKGPYLQSVTQESIIVVFETNTRCTADIDFGETDAYGARASSAGEALFHEITLSSLAPETRYHYRITITDGITAAATDDASFQTAPLTGSRFRISVCGDSRQNPETFRTISENILSDGPALVIHTGDYLTLETDDSLWETDFFDPAAELLRSTPLVPVLGNHEYVDSFCGLFSTPAAESGSSSEGYYSFQYGCVYVVVLNSNEMFYPTTDQYEWFETAIQSPTAQQAAWRFVCLHAPVYSSGLHGGDPMLQQYLVPLLEKNNVNMVFSGHDHLYEKSYKHNIYYIVSAGAGAFLYTPNTRPNPFQILSTKLNHHCSLDITPRQIDLTVKGIGREVIDAFTVTKQHDLLISSIEAPEFAYHHDLVHVSVAFQNIGNFTEQDVSVSLVSYGGEQNIGVQTLAELYSGVPEQATFQWQIPDLEPGDYELTAVIGGTSEEEDRTNNTLSHTIRIYER